MKKIKKRKIKCYIEDGNPLLNEKRFNKTDYLKL